MKALPTGIWKNRLNISILRRKTEFLIPEFQRLSEGDTRWKGHPTMISSVPVSLGLDGVTEKRLSIRPGASGRQRFDSGQPAVKRVGSQRV
jgi:hypothetical protein